MKSSYESANSFFQSFPELQALNQCVMKDFGKNYLGTLNFVVFVHEIQRKRKSVSSDEDCFFRDHHDFGRKIEKSSENLFFFFF